MLFQCHRDSGNVFGLGEGGDLQHPPAGGLMRRTNV